MAKLISIVVGRNIESVGMIAVRSKLEPKAAALVNVVDISVSELEALKFNVMVAVVIEVDCVEIAR